MKSTRQNPLGANKMTEGQVRRVFYLRSKGRNMPTIAEDVGTSTYTVRKVLNGARSDVHLSDDIKHACDAFESGTRVKRQTRIRKISDDGIVNMFRLRREGKTFEAIAQKYGISDTSVARIIQRKLRRDVKIPDNLMELSTPSKGPRANGTAKPIKRVKKTVPVTLTPEADMSMSMDAYKLAAEALCEYELACFRFEQTRIKALHCGFSADDLELHTVTIRDWFEKREGE